MGAIYQNLLTSGEFVDTAFALKFILTPTLVGIVSLAGRRWGPALSGWLVALPLIAGPLTFIMALDQGNNFASRVAQGTLLGQVSASSFSLTYTRLSFRFDWLRTLLVSLVVFMVLSLLLEQVSASLLLSFTGVVGFMAITFALMPKSDAKVIPTSRTFHHN